ncbi:DUF6894 family protein [Rhizobium mongolense]|jgi:hypothetical protein|uniref:DUF6894 domain-containing protein n=2 Tax=Rhizobium mongolense TaxID=57676 RepID=A0ABR6IG29_9HYPH|nr:hypothetical protein [Rhizobium mongolense]MBB4226822.1 hypothetical protein [Rhizobium mongolense]TVZ74045.1 hypothetical protein BCL32_2352 [Rhizobium mongolense USDA 1844]
MKYFYRVVGAKGELAETSREFDGVQAAKAEARHALTETAAGGLPETPVHMLSVELFDENRLPITELRLILEEISKE